MIQSHRIASVGQNCHHTVCTWDIATMSKFHWYSRGFGNSISISQIIGKETHQMPFPRINFSLWLLSALLFMTLSLTVSLFVHYPSEFSTAVGVLIALYYNYSQFLAAPWVQEPWVSYICIHSAYCLAQCCPVEMKCALHIQC